jgi:Flp pilus assembly protein TadD
VALWSGLTWHETGYWDNEMALWGRVLQISPSNVKAHMDIALLYEETGDNAQALDMLSDGLRYHPDSAALWFVRGGILATTGQTEAARDAFLKVLQVTERAPGQAALAGAGVHTRAAAAFRLAKMEIAAGHFTEAERYARMALSLNYNGVGYHSALAESLRGQERIDEARSENALELSLRLAQQRANGVVPASVRE